MKILYGVQGTGNGHISRARMMAKNFSEQGLEVDYLFSGRPKNEFFDMEVFGDFIYRQGLTFVSKNGKVSYPKTAVSNNAIRFLTDINKLDLTPYDKIITDFEPVTSWAAKLAKREVLGIGHQYAFGHKIPRAGDNPIANTTMKLFAPATHSLGLHWHHFDSTILPPIVDINLKQQREEGKTKIIVYLPFENQKKVQEFVSGLNEFEFFIYSPELNDQDINNIHLRKTSYKGFKKDLCSAHGVISNSGFELISECLLLGLQVLTKPQQAQMEQQSNAAALKKLGYATTMQSLERSTLEQWIYSIEDRPIVKYPDVAKTIVEWFKDGCEEPPINLCKKLWKDIELPDINS